MKKVIIKGIPEESKYYCDNHPKRECFSELRTNSWYGSMFDLTGINLHLCDECLTDVYKWLHNKFKIKIEDREI
jgi:hypothetical protein